VARGPSGRATDTGSTQIALFVALDDAVAALSGGGAGGSQNSDGEDSQGSDEKAASDPDVKGC